MKFKRIQSYSVTSYPKKSFMGASTKVKLSKINAVNSMKKITVSLIVLVD